MSSAYNSEADSVFLYINNERVCKQKNDLLAILMNARDSFMRGNTKCPIIYKSQYMSTILHQICDRAPRN